MKDLQKYKQIIESKLQEKWYKSLLKPQHKKLSYLSNTTDKVKKIR